jgi:hypothetical protein
MRSRLARIERRLERVRATRDLPQSAVVLYSPSERDLAAAKAANPRAPIIALTLTPRTARPA